MILPLSKSRMSLPSVNVSVRAGMLSCLKSAGDLRSRVVNGEGNVPAIGIDVAEPLLLPKSAIRTPETPSELHSLPSACSSRCRSWCACTEVCPTTPGQKHAYSTVSTAFTYPSSSSKIDILMPFGVCVVYRWMSEFEVMIVCFDQSLSRECSNCPTTQELSVCLSKANQYM